MLADFASNDSAEYQYDFPSIVDMAGRRFITDDMIEVVVYFGVCEKCDQAYWARQGPPFKRARRLVTV